MNHNQNQNFQNVNNFGHHAMHSRSTCTNVIESINKLIDISSDEDAKIARIALTKVIQNHVEAFTSVLVIPGYLLAHERSRDILDNLLTVINFPWSNLQIISTSDIKEFLNKFLSFLSEKEGDIEIKYPYLGILYSIPNIPGEVIMSILKRNYNLDKFSLKRGLSDSLVMQIKSEVEFHLQELLDMENEGPETEVIFPKK